MPLPNDAYPLATLDNTQIRADFMRAVALHSVAFTLVASPVSAFNLVDGAPYSVYATEACIIGFDTLALSPPAGLSGIMLAKGERASLLFPVGTIGLSLIGLTAAGTIYINQLIAWAGLTNIQSDGGM